LAPLASVWIAYKALKEVECSEKNKNAMVVMKWQREMTLV
jgi:hypothetical protein